MTVERGRGTVITVFSTASAVGKTLVSENMAAGLALAGNQVCLVDCDLQFGDVCNYLHLEPEVTLADAQRALKEDEANFAPEDFLTDYEHDTAAFSVLAAPLKLEEAYNISTKAVRFTIEVLRNQFDYIIVDTTSAFSELNLVVMDMSTLVTFLGIVDFVPTIKNMKIGCETLRSIGYDDNKIRLVLNRFESQTYIELNDVEQLLQEKFYHVLANDFGAAQKSINEGVPLICEADVKKLGSDLINLIGKFTNQTIETEQKQDGLFSWVSKIFKS